MLASFARYDPACVLLMIFVTQNGVLKCPMDFRPSPLILPTCRSEFTALCKALNAKKENICLASFTYKMGSKKMPQICMDLQSCPLWKCVCGGGGMMYSFKVTLAH